MTAGNEPPMRRAQDLWQTTCSALRDGREPDWQAVADYRRPLLVLLARRFPNLDVQAREDLVHDVLLDIKQSLHGKYDSRKGRFRSFLHTVVHNRVLKHFRSRRRERSQQLFEVEVAVSEADSIEVELVAEALGAVRRWLERAGPLGLRQVSVFSRQVGAGESIEVIAGAEQLPPHTVKRWLREARLAIVHDLLDHTLDLPAGIDVARLAGIALRALARRTSQRLAVLADVADAQVRASLEGWLHSFKAALSGFVRHETAASEEPLWAGLEVFLQSR